MSHDERSMTGHLAMFHTVTASSPSPMRRRRPAASGPLTTRPRATRRPGRPPTRVTQQLQRAQLPERPALADLVHAVHRPAERADYPEADQSAPTSPTTRARPAAGSASAASRPRAVGRRRPAPMARHVEQGLGGRSPWPKTRAARPGRERREQRQHGVVGQRRRQVGALVPENSPHACVRCTTRPAWQLPGGVGFAVVVRVGCGRGPLDARAIGDMGSSSIWVPFPMPARPSVKTPRSGGISRPRPRARTPGRRTLGGSGGARGVRHPGRRRRMP